MAAKKHFTISDAKAQLSRIVAEVMKGEEVVLTRSGEPAVLITRYRPELKKRRPGALKGKIKISADFDELPADIAAAFGLT